MTESLHHQTLVTRAVKAVRSALCGHAGLVCYADGSLLSDGSPPEIYGHRPDVFATTNLIVVVGEAKPPEDVESRRSEYQLGAFLNYVEEKPERHMVLAVDWSTSATAKSILKSLAHDWKAVRDRIHILDGQNVLAFPPK